MSRYLLFFFFILFSFQPCASELISTSEILRHNSYGSLKLSPNGEFLAGLRYKERQTILFAREIATEAETILVTLDKEQRDTIAQFEWVNRDTVFVNYFTPYQKLRLMEVYSDKNGIQNQGFDIKSNGALVDPVEGEKDRVIFARYLNADGKFEALDTTLSQLKAGKFEKSTILNTKIKEANAFSTDSSHRLRLATVRNEKKIELMFYSLEKKRWIKILHGRDKRDKFTPLAIYKNTIFALSNIGRDKVALVKISIETEEKTEVLFENPKYDLIDAEIDEDSGQLLSVSYMEYGKLSVKYFTSAPDISQLNIERFKDKRLSITNRSYDKKHIIYTATSSVFPGAYIYFNKELGKFKHLYDMMPNLSMEDFRTTTTELIQVSKSLDIEAYFTNPNTVEKQYPMVVIPHGGPIGVRDTNLFDKESQIFANRGFAVLRVNFRGSEGFGKAFQQAGTAQWGKQIEEDIELSVKHVLQKYPIDKKRICIMGASYGGYSALMSAIKYPQRYTCAISSFGVTDLPLLFSSTNIYQIEDIRKNIINVVGDVPSNIANAKNFSPVYRASEINIPVLILAGGKDRTAHPEHSERLHYVMRKLGKDSQYEFYRDSGHGHPTLNGKKHEILRKIEFLTTHLAVKENHSVEDKTLLAKENLFQATQYRPSGVVEKNLHRMVMLSQLAANNGNAEAEYLVGNYYEHGVTITKSREKAVQWYKKAAKSGHKLATLKIAKAYKYGSLNLKKSPIEALRYYKQAAKQNSFVGAYQMALLMICNDEKEKALKTIYGMKKTADNYSSYSVSELERTTKKSLDCEAN